jgi:hypothetical protein
MKTVLILHFLLAAPDAPPQISTQAAGQMADHNTCIIAGTGMAMSMEAANPGLTVSFACVVEGVAS